MKHLYIFDETNSNAAIYGVGTYINTLLLCLKNTQIRLTVFKLMSDFNDLNVIHKNGIRYIYIPKLNSIYASRTNYYRSVFFLIYPFISKKDKIIFHFNYLTCRNLAYYLKKYIPSAKILLTIHYKDYNDTGKLNLERELINKYCDRIIVLANHALKSLHKEYNTSLDKILMIPNAIVDKYNSSIKKEKLREYFGIDEKDFVILYAGRIDKNKNPCVLINSFIELVNQRPDIRLIVAGSGDYDSLLSKIDYAWGRITFTGLLNKETLFKLYNTADIGVIPSYYEEFGYCAIEMMMHGLPIIANKTSGLSEIVQDGVTGRLVEMCLKDKEESAFLLKKTICEMIEDYQLRYVYRINSRKRFIKIYEIKLFREKMINLYNQLFDENY